MTAEPIAFIAPFEGLAVQAEEIIRAGGYPARVWRGDLGLGVEAASEALDAGAKVIISRGGTAKRIQAELADRLTIDVIEVEASVYNIIHYLHENDRPDFRVAVVGFPQFTAMGRAVCENMGIIHRAFELLEEADAVPSVEALMQWRADAVLGDAISCRLLADLGWGSFHLIESSRHTVRDAFESARMVLGNLQRQIRHNVKLATVLSRAIQGFAIVGDDGLVEDINTRCQTLLGVTRKAVVGKPLSRLVPEMTADAMPENADGQVEQVIDRNGEQVIINLVPLESESPGEPGGMVMTVQPAKRIQEMENAIRTRLHKKGFFARRRLSDIIHVSPAMEQAIAIAMEYAKSDANIVITGDTGTGKELFAQGIHNASPRAGGMFVAVNCSSLSANLLESELFGYSPGAFTGALRTGKPGLFEMAHNGTLFLDEISEMDLFLQTRILRAIQEREIMRLGDSKVIPVNVRVIAAANKDLEVEVARGTLRMDLFFRLNVLNLVLPPLRERDGDIRLLLEHYLAKHAERMGVRLKVPGEEFFRGLDRYDWPGNVRELENLAERYVVLQNRPETGDYRTLLPKLGRVRSDTDIVVRKRDVPLKDATLDEVIRHTINKTLEEENGNIQRASRRLGVNRNTVKRWMREQRGEDEVRE